jgi:MYXO-CTERM domain-containing protein
MNAMVLGSLGRVAPLGLLAALTLSARSADAHFVLQAPACWMSQDSIGLPEKLGPCGDEDDGTDAATPSGIVTAYQVGATITVTINEEIFHPGHYRIALATTDRSQLPAEPLVEAGATACGSVPIEDPPVFPVLADNVFPHTAPFTSPQTTTVTLPANVTCTKCTLQVIEFMSDHGLNVPGGCFYHHCADISVSSSIPDGGTDSGATNDAGADAGVGAENEPTQAGCGCSIPVGSSPAAVGALAVALAWITRLRRRR